MSQQVGKQFNSCQQLFTAGVSSESYRDSWYKRATRFEVFIDERAFVVCVLSGPAANRYGLTDTHGHNNVAYPTHRTS